MKKLSIAFLAGILVTACGQDSDPYIIKSDHIGPLTKIIKINQLDSIFKNDSIARTDSGNQFSTSTKDIKIYDKDGSPLLILEPVQQFDSTSTIGYIQVLDSRYKTEKGLNLKSTFGEVVKNYKISRIENTLSAAVVFIDDLNLYLTIDKKELPASLRYDTDSQINASQIPDSAKIKYFMIGW